VIQVREPVPGLLEQCWEPSPIDGDVHFSEEEMEKINIRLRNYGDFVAEWQLAGPFSKEGVEGMQLFDVEFDPEKNINYNGWKEVILGDDGLEARYLNFEEYFGNEHSVAYLKTKIQTNESQTVLFEIGSDDGVKVWLNRQLVHQNNVVRGHNQGEDVIEVKLKEGLNEVIMKITQGVGGWGASLVITDTDHEVLTDLSFK